MSVKKARESANLANSADFTIVGFIDENGSISGVASYRTTAHGISVTSGEEYTLAFNNTQLGGWYLIFAWYNEFGTLTYERYTLNIARARYQRTVTAPVDATTLKISMVAANVGSDVMLNEGSTAPPYEPYGATIWEDCAVKSYSLQDSWHDTPVYVQQNGIWVEQT